MSDPAENLTAILEPIKAMFADMLRASGRPSVVQSESGVSSVKLNNLASGKTQVEVKVYHADPFEAARLARELYESEMTYWDDHEPKH